MDSRQGSSERASGPTVLVVEDDDAVRGLVVRILGSAGYDVLAAPDGRAALAVAESCERGIALVVSDVVMPGMSGPELVARLRARWPGLRALYTSGYASDALGEHGLPDAEHPVLDKPFDSGELLRRVGEVLGA